MKKYFLKIIGSYIIICLFSVSCLQVAMAQQTPSTDSQKAKMTPEQRVEMRENRMKQNLNLTDDQVSKVKQLLLQQETARMANKGEVQSADRKSMMNDFAKILTPEQMTKFTQMRSQQKPVTPSESK